MAKLSHSITIEKFTPSTEKKYTPQLLIPCEEPFREKDRHHFPCIDAIMVRRTVEHVRIFEEFAEAIKIAQSSVLIVDRHLFSEDGKNPNHKVRIDRVADWFLTSQIKSLKILTGHHDSQNYIKKTFDTLQELITEERDRAGTPLKIEISFALKDFDYIHDRFAIVDNELWHFGATVGGFHRDVNAASRGWDAELHRAVQFFDLAWMHSNKNGSNTS